MLSHQTPLDVDDSTADTERECQDDNDSNAGNDNVIESSIRSLYVQKFTHRRGTRRVLKFVKVE